MSFVPTSNLCSRRAVIHHFGRYNRSSYLLTVQDGVMREVANLTIEFRHQIR